MGRIGRPPNVVIVLMVLLMVSLLAMAAWAAPLPKAAAASQTMTADMSLPGSPTSSSAILTNATLANKVDFVNTPAPGAPSISIDSIDQSAMTASFEGAVGTTANQAMEDFSFAPMIAVQTRTNMNWEAVAASGYPLRC